MKISEIEGDLFKDLIKGDVVAHGCNSFGVVGGVAGIMKDKFPNNFANYAEMCKMRGFIPGTAHYFKEDDISIYNLGTQWKPGADAHIINVISSVRDMVNYAAFS